MHTRKIYIRLPAFYSSHQHVSPSKLFAGITTLNYTIITLALVSYLRSSVVRALHQHRKGVGSIPAGGPIIEFFSTVPGWFFDMCMISLELKTHLPFRINQLRINRRANIVVTCISASNPINSFPPSLITITMFVVFVIDRTILIFTDFIMPLLISPFRILQRCFTSEDMYGGSREETFTFIKGKHCSSHMFSIWSPYRFYGVLLRLENIRAFLPVQLFDS